MFYTIIKLRNFIGYTYSVVVMLEQSKTLKTTDYNITVPMYAEPFIHIPRIKIWTISLYDSKRKLYFVVSRIAKHRIFLNY